LDHSLFLKLQTQNKLKNMFKPNSRQIQGPQWVLGSITEGTDSSEVWKSQFWKMTKLRCICCNVQFQRRKIMKIEALCLSLQFPVISFPKSLFKREMSNFLVPVPFNGEISTCRIWYSIAFSQGKSMKFGASCLSS
jgi:hypothetical protein